MPFDFQRARPLLQSCNLTKLFIEELGWEPCHQKLSHRVSEVDYAFTAQAEKKGFIAWICEASKGGLPEHAVRLKLERKLSETNYEHLIVFVTKDHSRQSWMWARREPGKPLATRTHEYDRGQPGDSLLQKLQVLFVSLEEEEAGLSPLVMPGRAKAAFDIERVTKAFYRDFDTHRKAFLKFIDGIGEVADREWYASVMLNRLMFVYFIQRKGFLDNDQHYLRNRLVSCKKEKGKDKFYSFYRFFLLRLFHEGFGKQRKDRASGLDKLLGNIPYLNGGLFDVHELEKHERYGKDIQISDKAFERIFDYFDKYQWHLDDRPLRADNEINPDVLGYIFEKYINQKQMGAYYTKEDITEYISKSCIIPFLFDAARAKCKVAFDNPGGPTVWDQLRDNPDRYIYDAVKKGVSLDLPKEIAIGLDTKKPNLLERRKAWNKPAPAEYALPTEIWREVVARRLRYEEVKKKLAAGEVRDINDFITLNLDLRQFAQDVIQNCEGPDLLTAFWQAISTITILDPTGGSGAFIFAALNILEPLYEGCLERMEAFLAEWGDAGKKLHPNYHKKFTAVLANVNAHPNPRYFIYKSIILNNLYAVDIMEEAVEICKLRLFLKLAAQVEPDSTKDNLGIEPLPDIDFNIRAGNSLVGYATYDEVKRAVTGKLDYDNAMEKISVKVADLQQTFDKFRQLQTEGDGSVPFSDKSLLQKRLKALEDELNHHLAIEYGVKVTDKAAYAKWAKTHQPFHWFIQFYRILTSGGFDVIIGNPPYVEYKDVKSDYIIKNYRTEACGNLYAFTLERAYSLVSQKGYSGLIVPLSLVSTERMKPLQEMLATENSRVWLSLFDVYPTKLFDGAKQRLTICLTKRQGQKCIVQSTKYNRWYSDERETLLQRLTFAEAPYDSKLSSFPKFGESLATRIYNKVAMKKPAVFTNAKSGVSFYVHRIPYNFVKAIDFIPYFWNEVDGKKKSEDYKPYQLNDKTSGPFVLAAINSNLFFWWWYLLFEGYHCGKHELFAFPVGDIEMSDETKESLVSLARKLKKDLQANKNRKECIYKNTGKVVYDEFFPRLSKPLIDEIDSVLAEHYGFTAEELDFIINYDIKYRLGSGGEQEEE